MWLETIINSLEEVWVRLTEFLPDLLLAIIVLVIGLLLAGWLGKLATKLINFLKLDDILTKSGFSPKVEAAGVKFNLAALTGWLVKWFFVIVVLITVTDILDWKQITEFLNAVVLYIPNVFVAIIILTIGLMTAHFVYNIVERAISVSKVPSVTIKPLAALSKWSIVIFAILAALVQLGVATSLIEILFTGLVAMLALAGGLAFGLGGKEKASKWLDVIERELSQK